MTDVINVYCDESCHLENDGMGTMVLGAVWCPMEKRLESATRIREIKLRHGLPPGFEVKWSKVSPAKSQFYQDLLDYFFDDDHLGFRAVVIDKKQIDHRKVLGQSHDEWYYKMLYQLLQVIFVRSNHYRIFLDIKDTRSESRVRQLHDILRQKLADSEGRIVTRLQQIRSHEVEHLQMTDLLIGAVGYANRQLAGNAGKVALVQRFRQRSGFSLLRSTLPSEKKTNIFHWIGER